ncbi:hypothetical protein MOQ_002927 [Trypanosoma cruzi marinkellei]|uniref:Uncharacterized protein n=1 Tax=Trypanosoma cruzi marinkellei TaxID=85056 RepID=K2NE48_TRYCR|nr:hypothetical protein MOQ_002927 [Trypanosoma cruzi marinkellei]
MIRRAGSSFRRRTVTEKAVQTEVSFPFECMDTDRHYEQLASEQFQDLCRLRDLIREAMKEVACSVYDVVAFKDIIFKIEDELPSKLPVTDILLLSSKLFRRTSGLGHLLACLFAVMFAEEHADENFRFTAIRFLRRELLDVKRQFARAEKERVRLQRMLDDVGRVAMNHSRAVDLLETRNTALQMQTSGLEDQMALLFSQVNRDLHRQCKEAYEKVTNEIDSQDRMGLTRVTFRQTMDSLSDQLRHSRSLINDVRELVISCAQGSAGVGKNVDAQISKEPSIRFKLKQVENNFQQLVGRFSSVKGVVAETAQELMNALQERKNILYLSLQHIRLYDIQNSRMRQSKAIVVTMRKKMEELLKRISLTFPSGAVTFVDRIGRISTQQWQVGQTLATLRQQKNADQPAEESFSDAGKTNNFSPGIPPSKEVKTPQEDRTGSDPSDADLYGTTDITKIPFQTVYNLVDVIKQAEDSMENLNNVLNFESEINAFLKTLTLSLSTTPRHVDESLGELENEEEIIGRAVHPTGNLSIQRPSMAEHSLRKSERESEAGAGQYSLMSSFHGDRRDSTDVDRRKSTTADQNEQLKKLQEQLDNIQPEFAAKINFLRQVYEARICDLETKEGNYARRLNSTSPQREGRERRESKIQLRSDRSLPISQSQEVAESEKPRKKGDKDQLLQARSDWQQTKPVLQANKKTRDATLGELNKMMKGEGNSSTKSGRRSAPRSKSSSAKTT